MRSLSFILLSLLVLTPASCQNAESGTLTVEYQLGPSDDASACQEFSVNRVRATLGDELDELTEEADCGDDIVFTGIDVGRWDLRVDALAADGTVVMDNEAEQARVEILGGAATTHKAQLTETPARVFVRWALSVNNFQADCAGPMVETAQFRVQAWDGAATVGEAETFDCLAPQDPEAPTYARVQDPDRQIRGSLLTEVTITAMDAAGNDLVPTTRFIFDLELGPGRKVFLTVDCIDNMCMSTGEPPWDTP